MSLFSALVVAAIQVPASGQQPAPQLPPSPIAKLVVSPAKPTMTARDTLQLSAQALDASGKPVDNVRYRFIQSSGARFEGKVDTTGLVRSGSTGTIPVTVVALVPGTRPVTEVVEVKMLPGPAAKVVVDAAPPKLVVGQQVVLTGTAYSAAGDQRADKLSWNSSAPNVARVTGDGRLVAVAPGSATITASTGQVAGRMYVELWRGRYRYFAKHSGPLTRRLVCALVRAGMLRKALAATWDARRGRLAPATARRLRRTYGAVWRLPGGL